MRSTFDLLHPWLLLLLPLAALPFLRVPRHTLPFSSLAWLPRDRLGELIGVLWKLLAGLSMACIVVALSGPGRPQTQVQRVGRGAEILLLMDRSRSMDEHMLPSDWRKLGRLPMWHDLSRGQAKAQAASELLSKFVAQRPDDRFAVMFFSTKPLLVVGFTQHADVVQAGIAAGDIGRGLANTEAGRALLAANAQFDHRPYTGSRIILLVSDGGAFLDEQTRTLLRAGLERNHVALYWIYLRSFRGPMLDEADRVNSPEIALHAFFQTLHTPYRAYQAEIPEELAHAVEDVGRQQNFPLDFFEEVPRQDYRRSFLAVAALACLSLLGLSAWRVRSWP
ncbi:MAG: VWA domain-containing protein [Sinobacteraceae bacterium]|nr:VWA domain-containing protein [Nevskiaceae bacterium]